MAEIGRVRDDAIAATRLASSNYLDPNEFGRGVAAGCFNFSRLHQNVCPATTGIEGVAE